MKIKIDTNIKEVTLNIKVEDLRDLMKSFHTFHDFNNFSSIFRKSSRWNFPKTKEEKKQWIKQCVVDDNLELLITAMEDFKGIKSFYEDNFPMEAFYAIGRDALKEIDKNQSWTIERKERQ